VARNSWEGTLRIYPAKNDLFVDTAKAGFVTANRYADLHYGGNNGGGSDSMIAVVVTMVVVVVTV
jgi:hypothetical protein